MTLVIHAGFPHPGPLPAGEGILLEIWKRSAYFTPVHELSSAIRICFLPVDQCQRSGSSALSAPCSNPFTTETQRLRASTKVAQTFHHEVIHDLTLARRR